MIWDRYQLQHLTSHRDEAGSWCPRLRFVVVHSPVSPEVELFNGTQAVHQGTEDAHSLLRPECGALRWKRVGQVQHT